MSWVHAFEMWLRHLATLVPLEIFVLVGGFIEEVVGPIPSMLVMTTAGALAHLDGRTAVFVFWLVILGNLGKIVGAWGYYYVGDKLEDIIVGKCGRFLGLTHADIEKIGRRFDGNHWKDGGTLFLLRLVPFFPVTIISIACGVIKMDIRAFLIATYLGNILKDSLYAYSGYTGLRLLYQFFHDAERIRWGIGTLILFGVLITLTLLYIHRHEGMRFFEYVCSRFRKK